MNQLSAHDLEQFALLDSPELSTEQRAYVAQVRQRCDLLPGGASAHVFRVVAAEEGSAGFVFECASCDSKTDAQYGALFLNNAWYTHLNRPQHQRNAAARLAASLAAQYDVASEAAAQAAQMAAVSPSELATMRAIADKAQAAAERAAKAAREAEHLLDPRPPAAGTILSDLLEATELQRLVKATPALTLTAASDDAQRRVECTWCKHPFSATQTDAQLLPQLRTHLNSAEHRMRASFGIMRHFGVPKTGPSPAPMAAPDRSTLCFGYYKNTALVDGHMIDVSSLLEYQPVEDSLFYPEPHLRYTLRRATMGEAPPEEIKINGTLRSRACRLFSLDEEGNRLPDAMCSSCRGIFSHDAVRKLAMRRAQAATQERDSSRVRFDFMSPQRRVEVMRALANKVRELKGRNFLLSQSYLRKAARVAGLKERLHEFGVRGDAKALIDDVITLERDGEGSHILGRCSSQLECGTLMVTPHTVTYNMTRMLPCL